MINKDNRLSLMAHPLMPTLLPGLGPLFLGILMGSRTLTGWRLCGPSAGPFWLHSAVTLAFLRPGFRPL